MIEKLSKNIKLLSQINTFLIVLWGIIVVAVYFTLPDIIPSHFNIKGEITATSPKITIFILYIIFALIAIALKKLKKYPEVFNYPVKINESNREIQKTLSISLITVLNFILLFFGTLFTLSHTSLLKNYVSIIAISFIILILGSIFYYLILAFKNK